MTDVLMRGNQARRATLTLDAFARATGLHPDLVRRLVSLGLLEPASSHEQELRFAPSQVATAARLQRLRAGLALNYAALGVVCDLLDRIAELEAALRTRNRSWGGPSWT
jgi:DNA-binding transcriptional MerR regulator